MLFWSFTTSCGICQVNNFDIFCQDAIKISKKLDFMGEFAYN